MRTLIVRDDLQLQILLKTLKTARTALAIEVGLRQVVGAPMEHDPDILDAAMADLVRQLEGGADIGPRLPVIIHLDRELPRA